VIPRLPNHLNLIRLKELYECLDDGSLKATKIITNLILKSCQVPRDFNDTLETEIYSFIEYNLNDNERNYFINKVSQTFKSS